MSVLRKSIYSLAVTVRGEQSVFRRLSQLRQQEFDDVSGTLERQRLALAVVLGSALQVVPALRRFSYLAADLTHHSAAQVLEQLPILEKRDLQRCPEEYLSVAYRGPRRSKTTGGSTGRPVTVWKDPDSIAQEMAASWLGYGWFGLAPGDASVRFWGLPTHNRRRRLRYAAADIAMNRATLSAFGYDDTSLQRYLLAIERKRPAYLYGYVSALEDLARYVLRSGGEPPRSLRCVVTTSEVLSEPQRSVIRQAFRVPVQNEYGCGEVGPIAYECPQGSLHLIPSNHYVEIVREDGSPAAAGEEGSVLITDLTNKAMPLIRYRVGDIAASGEACMCGRSMPVLRRVYGRAYDFVLSPSGKRYHGEFFMYLFEDLRGEHPSIGQFQVVQTGANALSVTLVHNDATDIRAVQIAVEQRLPDFSVEVRSVANIPRRASGKMLVVENRIADQHNASRLTN